MTDTQRVQKTACNGCSRATSPPLTMVLAPPAPPIVPSAQTHALLVPTNLNKHTRHGSRRRHVPVSIIAPTLKHTQCARQPNSSRYCTRNRCSVMLGYSCLKACPSAASPASGLHLARRVKKLHAQCLILSSVVAGKADHHWHMSSQHMHQPRAINLGTPA